MARLKTFSQALRLITRDPVNLFLAVVPTVLALFMYLFTAVWVFRHAKYIELFLMDILPSKDAAGILGIIMTGILILFVFLVMSWTFVMVVGIIAAPFNSMLSSRIEKKLVQHVADPDKKEALQKKVASIRR